MPVRTRDQPKGLTQCSPKGSNNIDWGNAPGTGHAQDILVRAEGARQGAPERNWRASRRDTMFVRSGPMGPPDRKLADPMGGRRTTGFPAPRDSFLTLPVWVVYSIASSVHSHADAMHERAGIETMHILWMPRSLQLRIVDHA